MHKHCIKLATVALSGLTGSTTRSQTAVASEDKEHMFPLISAKGVQFVSDNWRRTPSLRCQHLTRTFGDGGNLTTVVNNVSLDFFSGQVVLILGPSGCGKSTLLAILSGLLRPSSGRVIALGQDLWKLSERDRERFRLRHCGFIFQNYNLFPALSARQQLEIVLRWGEGVSDREARRRSDEALALLGLAKKAHLRPIELSGGEKQRVALARALVKKPTFYFADEPTCALDWSRGRQVIELLRATAHNGHATVLIVTHDTRIMPYVDQVYHLEDGRLCEPGNEPAINATFAA